MKSNEYSTVLKSNGVWFVSDDDYQSIISDKKNVEIDNHTFEIRNYKTEKVYVFSFATGITVKPISSFHKKKIVYSDKDCTELYEKGYHLDDNILDYTDKVTEKQFEQWLKDNHSNEYSKYIQDYEYKLYNSDKVSQEDLKDFLLQPEEPVDNPFSDYVQSHGNFMKKNCPYTYYSYDTKFNEYCILHLICGETKKNIWTNNSQTKVYGVQKYRYNPDTNKVDKLFILGKPHVEIFRGNDEDSNIVICVESFVKAFTLWNSLKKQYTIITTHSKYIKTNDLRFINENFEDYDLAILCDTDAETSDIVAKTRSKYQYYPLKDRKLKSIFGIIGNKQDKDINDSIRTALKICRSYFDNISRLNKLRIKL